MDKENRTAFRLAQQAQDAGLVVVMMKPFECRHDIEFTISLWQPDGKLWAEGTHEKEDSVLEHIRRWKEHS